MPLNLSELLDYATRTYSSLGGLILRETAVPLALFYLVLVFVAEFLVPAMTETQNPNSIAVQASEVGLALGVTLVAAVPLLLIGLSYTSGLVSRLTADHLLGHAADVRSARHAARAGLGALVAVNLRILSISFALLVVSCGLLFTSAALETSPDAGWLVLAGVAATIGLVGCFLILPIAASRYALAPAIVVVEGLRASAAARRAVALCRKSPPHPSGYDPFMPIWMLVGILVLTVWGGTSIGLEMLGTSELGRSLAAGTTATGVVLKFVELLPWYLAVWTVAPLWSTICTIHYFDRRIRLEGYDIELLEQDARRSLRTSRFQL